MYCSTSKKVLISILHIKKNNKSDSILPVLKEYAREQLLLCDSLIIF